MKAPSTLSIGLFLVGLICLLAAIQITLKNQPLKAPSALDPIRVNTTSSEELATNNNPLERTTVDTNEGFIRYDMSSYGFTFAYPETWQAFREENQPRITLDPPGEKPNPYTDKQGEGANPSDDIIIQTKTIKSIDSYFSDYIFPGSEQPKKLIFKDHLAYTYYAPGDLMYYEYIIQISENEYMNLLTPGDETLLDSLVEHIIFVPSTPEHTSPKGTLKKFSALNLGVELWYPTRWNVRFSEDPTDLTVTIDPPGEGGDPTADVSKEWTNPTDDIVISKITIDSLDEYLNQNMIPHKNFAPKRILVDNHDTWAFLSGDAGSVTYGTLVHLDGDQYLEITSMEGEGNFDTAVNGIFIK